jgi:hypothetical protein
MIINPTRVLSVVNVWEERAGRNEALFRSINDALARSEEESRSDSFPAFCECSFTECTTHVEVSFTDYARVRRQEDRFIVAPGHEQPEIEQVVEEHHPDYVVVEKHGEAAAAAEADS